MVSKVAFLLHGTVHFPPFAHSGSSHFGSTPALNKWKSKMKNLCQEYDDKIDAWPLMPCDEYTMMAVYQTKCIKCFKNNVSSQTFGESILPGGINEILSFLRRRKCMSCLYPSLI